MNLYAKLQTRASQQKPIRVALIGAGKFGSMFLAQAVQTPGMHITGIADLSPERVQTNLNRIGWEPERAKATSVEEAIRTGQTFLCEDAMDLIQAEAVEVVIDATGSPAAGIRHALAAIEHGKHIVMVNVEADTLAGPLLAEKARKAGVVYSLAYGDQPALIAEIVDWARACGLSVVAAGKGTKYLPIYHEVTPDTVWQHYGLTPEAAQAGGMNPQMFNSFLDGTKSAIEMAAVANACDLRPPDDGLGFPACGVDDLPHILRPKSVGGILEHEGMVEVISSLERDSRPVFRDLRWGVYAVFAAPSDYTKRCFAEYGLKTDSSGCYSSMYKPYHLIGLELGISVASAALRGEPTGQATGFRGDVVAVAKRDLKVGEMLDGEGGYTVWGKLVPAQRSLSLGGLPIGLAHRMALRRPVARGQIVTWEDVAIDQQDSAVAFRREMEQAFQALN